ncbi:hypothetical protein BDN70DRAFT_703482 [Pholiota conissans]|uniref:Uncharacterized protein n=1 Tax=Pholiota conissans TaxID=109636 RepID=A0A9P5Z4A6_9AGAR|nr:hypothetical protein BDN70DRAFT_703482 [Pholiota conissans]
MVAAAIDTDVSEPQILLRSVALTRTELNGTDFFALWNVAQQGFYKNSALSKIIGSHSVGHNCTYRYFQS